MKNIFLIGVCWLFFQKEVSAQKLFPKYFEIKTDTALAQRLDGTFLDILKDSSSTYSFKQVNQQPLNQQFKSTSRKTGNCTTFWFRYGLVNQMQKPVRISISDDPDFIDFFISVNNKNWKHFKSGGMQPWSKKDGFKKVNAIPLELNPGDSLRVFIRAEYSLKRGITRFYQQFYFTDRLLQNAYIQNEGATLNIVKNSLLFGLLLLACVINLFFFYIVREKIYLYYSLFLFCRGLASFNDTITNLIFRESPGLGAFYISDWINIYSSLFFLFFLIHFVRHLLKTAVYTPRWNKFLIITSIIQSILFFTFAVIMPLFFGVQSKWASLVNISVIITTTSVFFTFILYFKTKNDIPRILLIAALPALILWGVLYSIFQVLLIINIANQSVKLAAFINTARNYINYIEVVCIFWLVFIFTWVLFQRFILLRKENAQQALDKERLAKEKEIERNQLIQNQKIELEREVADRTAELKHSLEELKTTQSQLIQSEKMASLGELTAGIAHEIQNPLNFVNNFSEVSVELLEELEEEVHKGNTEEVLALSADLKENLSKIAHHGKRADGIVKGMLQHSRVNNGQKELTDINALADEYLRLSYHGLRAKDKSFNATLETNYAPEITKLEVMPQDLGRVLLNLFNNAFYAVSEKKKTATANYIPTVSVSTQQTENEIEIKVKDNGVGIPSAIKNKILQPFFTTKPTGQGTGLGLSLSYDIITKGHGGSLDILTEEGEFSEFILRLPRNNG